MYMQIFVLMIYIEDKLYIFPVRDPVIVNVSYREGRQFILSCALRADEIILILSLIGNFVSAV